MSVCDIFARILKLRIHNFHKKCLVSFKGAAKCFLFVLRNDVSSRGSLSQRRRGETRVLRYPLINLENRGDVVYGWSLIIIA